ncbi:(2Z,6Z)-farnesyl diphosphate synthase CPT6, chloroplastic-like [Salvia hispanica]|uniref:(2Z,6Z)-farnesyl diphosphate synthase CPT6, chloroplastic-like n=1 Tax=Salvia hispanica TaxID=49212 RepID=UPI0020099C02|nr:(2Z,6Z)-farnesyl diphosphate synthase CPT6, chloroplastic-like [Salvia hispanica]
MPRACLAGATVSANAVKKAVEEALMPKHVAIIMDGNGKWARDRKLVVGDGFRADGSGLNDEIYRKLHTNRCQGAYNKLETKSKLPVSLQSSISWAEETSKCNKGMNLVMAANYSGRDNVVQATKRITAKVEGGILRATDIDEVMFEQELMTNAVEFPNPDLLIRTSGDLTISGFLLWQLAYTEFYFADKLFPDFGEDDLLQALASYGCRQRRYSHRKN